MTFKHRLARRLAQSRTIGGAIALTLFSACSGGSDTAGPTPDSLVAATPKPGTITSVQNASKCLDVTGESTKDGTALITYACNGGSNQAFTYYTDTQELRVYNGTKCVDATGELGRDGDPIIIWSCNGGANQKWQWTSAKEIKGINGKCIDLSGGSAANMAKLILKTCSGASSQKWDASRVMVAGTTPPPPPPSGSGEQARAADDFVNSIGLNTHLFYTNTPYYTAYGSVVKPRLQELGVRHIRDHAIRMTDGNANMLRSRLQDLASIGTRSLLILDERYVSPSEGLAFVKSVGSAVDAVEGWNEPDRRYSRTDFSWVSKAKAYMSSTWSLFKADPATASLPIGSPSFDLFATAGYMGDMSGWINFGSIHPYPLWPNYPTYTDRVQAYKNAFSGNYRNRPFWVTETGYHTGAPGSDRPVSLAVHGKYTPRMLLEYFNRGIERNYNYALIDQCTTYTNRECAFGLLKYDGSPKPAFIAVKNLIAVLKDPGAGFTPGKLEYSLSGSTSGLHRALFQKRNGTFYLVLWLEVASSDTDRSQSVTLNLARAAASVRTYLPKTSATPVLQKANVTTVSLAVPDHPLVVEITP
ncbi:MAG TPA: RICIN domain-containing protein [Gemmatimonadales bacterium]|nr:RICIN domain-containing protein [Gemmatimonadales bacterium]